MTAPTRIAVVDDHELFRSGVVELLQTVAEFEVVSEGATGVEAITVAHETHPDVLLLDVEMPGPGAAATIRKILDASPATRVVILTMHDDPELVRTLLDAGASGYLVKSAGRTELVAAISTAARGDATVLMSVSRSTALSLTTQSGHTPAQSVLSSREAEILSLLAEGRGNRDIASALYISEGTVKRHVANVYRKLDVSSRVEAIRKAIQIGAITNTFANESAADR